MLHVSRRSLSDDSLDLLLQRCRTPRQAKQVHAQLLLLFPSSAFLSARLISLYSLLGLFPSALSVFLSSPCPRPSLLYNSILRASLSHHQPLKALSLYLQMTRSATAPDGFTYPLAVRACTATADPKMAAPLHNQIIISGFHTHVHVSNELVSMYAKLGRMGIARKMFDAMPVRNVVSWNVLVSGYAANGEAGNAREVFREMEAADGVLPNAVTWTSLLSAHARCRRHEEVVDLFEEMVGKGVKGTAEAAAVVLSVCPYVKGRRIHGYVVKSGFGGFSFVRNSIICMYGKDGKREEAERVFLESEEANDLVSWNALISSFASAGLCNQAYEVFVKLERNGGEVKPNVVSWSAVIGALASNGMVEESLGMFKKMQRAAVQPNSITIATVLSACAELSALALGREVHCHTIRARMDQNILVGNGLLNMYTKSGRLRQGQLVFDQIKEKDLISWNSMIAGFGIHGFCNQALSTFGKMGRAGCQPDGITFVALLSACSHAGRVSEGRRLFDQMVNEYNIMPVMEHYSCMVDLLGRAGLLREASDLVKGMPMRPNVCVWGALLNSCRIYGNPMAAEDSSLRVLGLEEEIPGNCMLLSNIYAASGQWEESAKVRVMTKAKGLKKKPGQSWIEVRKKVHVFSAGNLLPPGTEEAYGVLEDLSWQMESEKFVVEVLEDGLLVNSQGQVGVRSL